MKAILVSFLLFGVARAYLTCGCGWETKGIAAHGYVRRKGEFPWMVAIMKKRSTIPFCSGTIVTPWHIITSAKCVSDRKARDVVVIVGANDLKSQTTECSKQHHTVEKIIIHPSYKKSSLVDDIAVLVSNEQIEFTEYVGPACFPNGIEVEELPGQEMKVMGWGAYDTESAEYGRKKVSDVDLEVIVHETCKKKKGKSIRLCTSALEEDTCKGESGDPLVWEDPENGRYTLVGIVSSGPKDCSSKDPGVNISVQAYVNWINRQIKNTKEDVRTCREVDA